MRCAIVDIGSNTLKMNIYDVSEDKSNITLILNESKTLGLINYTYKNHMSDAGIFKLIETIDSFHRLAVNVNADKFYCIATASLRNVDNSDEITTLVKERTNLDIDLISGENEAILSFEGLKHGFSTEIRSGIMIDMGGGSTELLGFVDGLAVRAMSVEFGCLSLHNRFVNGIFPEKSERKSIKNYIDKQIGDVNWFKNYGDTVYLVGGTGRALGKLHNDIYKSSYSENGYLMKYDEVAFVNEYFKYPEKSEIDVLIKNVPDRLHTIIPGMIAYMKLFKYIGAQNIIVTDSGLREGYLLGVLK